MILDLLFSAIAGKGLSETGRFSWKVSSPGQANSSGVVDGAAHWPRLSGDRRWIGVRLRPGWSSLVWVNDAEFDRMIVGATVLADGVAVGTTDESDQCTLLVSACPKSIDERYRDWRCTQRPGAPKPLVAFEPAHFWTARK